jgi:twitching motility protein PilI
MQLTSVQNINPLRKRPNGEPFLRVKLDKKTTALIPIDSLQAVINISAHQINPLPNTPNAVVGVINRRSKVVWVVDLPQILGLPAIDRNLRTYNLLIVNIENEPFGVLLPEVEGINRFPLDQIQSPIDHWPESFIPYLRGCILSPPELLLVLDLTAIINSPLLQNQ